MATLLFTYMVAESKALRESKFLNQTYIQVRRLASKPSAYVCLHLIHRSEPSCTWLLYAVLCGIVLDRHQGGEP